MGTKITAKQSLIAMILIAVAFSAGTISQYDREIKEIVNAELTEAEVNAIIGRYLTSEEGRDYLMQQVIRTDVWNDHILELRNIDTPDISKHNHPEYAVVAHNHNQYSIQSHTHSTSTTSGNSGDFDLELCQDVNCTDNSVRFDPGDTVYLRGEHHTNDRQLDYEIFDPDNRRIADSGIGIASSGPFSMIWQIPNNAEKGTYTIIIEIDRNEDEIDFIVK